MDTLLIIDGNAIMHRAYHALPPFKTSLGIPTNVIYGFFGMLNKALQSFQPSHVAICFDTPAQTFRQKMHLEYQAQRPSISDDFKEQIPLLKNLLDKSGIYREEQDGLEADDVIGTITEKAKKHKMRTLILTGDKDIMQLVNHHVFVIAPKMGLSDFSLYDEDAVIKKLGVNPEKIPDYKALAGDPSDNYHGAKGIGPKTAIKLLTTYETVENLIKNVEKITDSKQKTMIKDNIKNIKMSKKLATIICNADIRFTFDKAKFDGFPISLRHELERLEMKTLVVRLFNGEKKETKSEKIEKPKKEINKDQIGLF